MTEPSLPQQSSEATVWCVWTETGDYEQWSRDLRGTFATEALAEAHAQQLRTNGNPDVCEVTAEPVLGEVPARVPYIRWSAHINADGCEDQGLGFERGELFKTYANEITSAQGDVRPWNSQRPPDLFVEVIGCDQAAVEAEYARLLAVARDLLVAATGKRKT